MPQYLTKRQRELLNFLEEFIARNGYSPSLEEICKGIGLSSLATVHVHLRNLESKKMIRRGWNRSRSIELTAAGLAWGASREAAPTAPSGGVVEVPLLGRVAAGVPIEAIEDRQTVGVPSEFVRGKETFVLRVQGDSMIEEQIRDGDLVIVERRETAENGETVVALVHGGEATVKIFYHADAGRIRLQPANHTMPPIFVPAEACQIQGVVVGLLRKY
jgi:repressor LexA